MTTHTDPPKPRIDRLRIRALATFRAFGIDRATRLEVTSHLLDWDEDRLGPLDTFNRLTEPDLERVVDACVGATLIAHVCLERRAGLPRCPQCGRR